MGVLVSIIVPNYNSEKYIKETLDSVLAQTYQDWEMLVIDDCSSDGSVDIIRAYAEKDSRIQLILREKNTGVANVRNAGLELAKGKYIALLDSDDVWTEDKLERQVALLEETGAEIAYSAYDFIDENSQPMGKTFKVPEKTNFKKMLACNVIGCSAAIVRADIFKEHPFNPDYYHEDYVLWMELLRLPVKAVGDKKVLMHYRRIATSRSYKKGNAAKQRWAVYRKVLKLSWFSASWAFIRYAVNGVLKYR
ncbi:MAG: glycosyltransferase family 2 protein [Clostridia bacterium]|nr:glycosyltransferase family 2 protein [Clostridia bacterium]